MGMADDQIAATEGIRADDALGLRRARRKPIQRRSRESVRRILEATEAIVAEDGVDAVTTRAIAERAGVAPPSIYRFFSDRDEILDALLETMLEDLDVHAASVERRFTGGSIEELIRLEFELHVAYYERHPSLPGLWFGGRVSAPVVELVRARNEQLADRLRRVLVEAGLISPRTPEVVLRMLVEYGDRTLEVAFRDRRSADRDVIEAGIDALTSSLEQWRKT